MNYTHPYIVDVDSEVSYEAKNYQYEYDSKEDAKQIG